MAKKARKVADEWISMAVNPLAVELDVENPRIEAGPRATQASLRELLVRNEGVISLVDKIAHDGLLPAESIILVKEDGKLVVVEGNRRVCACQMILDPSLRPAGYKRDFSKIADQITAQQRNKLEHISAQLAPNRKAAERVITRRHTEPGVKQWTPIAKQRRVARLLRSGTSIDDIAEQFDMKAGAVRKLANEFSLVEYVRQLKFWSPDERDALRSPTLATNPFTRFFTLKGAKEVLGIKFADNGTFESKRVEKSLLDDALVRIARELLLKPEGALNTRATALEVYRKVFGGNAKLLALLAAVPEASDDDVSNQGNETTGPAGPGAGFLKETKSEDAADVDVPVVTRADDAQSSAEQQSHASAGEVRGSESAPADAPNQQNQPAPGSHKKRPQAKKTDDFFTTLTCDVEDDHVKRFANELQRIPYEKYPTAATALVRGLLEATLNWCINHKGLRKTLNAELLAKKKPQPAGPDGRAPPPTPPREPGLEDLIRFCAKHYAQIFSENRAKNILESWYDHNNNMNLILHGRWMFATPQELEHIASKMRPFLQAILNKQAILS